jgi:DtxR family Mn-dependent transcriptional regulator
MQHERHTLEAVIKARALLAEARSEGETLTAQTAISSALKSLARGKLVNYDPYEFVTLTEAGRRNAEEVAGRHRMLQAFFVDVLGLSDESAGANACRIEHAALLGGQATEHVGRIAARRRRRSLLLHVPSEVLTALCACR